MSDSKSTLLAILPLLLIIAGLIIAITLIPGTSLDIRQRAAEPTPIPTPLARRLPTPTLPPTACTTLYSPVCGSNQKTYASACEATQANIRIVSQTACPSRSNY